MSARDEERMLEQLDKYANGRVLQAVLDEEQIAVLKTLEKKGVVKKRELDGGEIEWSRATN
jgi:hypothetical protein